MAIDTRKLDNQASLKTFKRGGIRSSDLLKGEAMLAGDAEDFPIHVDTDIEDDDEGDLYAPIRHGFLATPTKIQKNIEKRMARREVKKIREWRRRINEMREYRLRQRNIERQRPDALERKLTPRDLSSWREQRLRRYFGEYWIGDDFPQGVERHHLFWEAR